MDLSADVLDTSIMDLPKEIVGHISDEMDALTRLVFTKTCKWFEALLMPGKIVDLRMAYSIAISERRTHVFDWLNTICTVVYSGHGYFTISDKAGREQHAALWEYAAAGENIPALEWLKEMVGCAPKDVLENEHAAVSRVVIEWGRSHGIPLTAVLFRNAVYSLDTDHLQWLMDLGCPHQHYTITRPVFMGRLDIVEWLHDRGCMIGGITIEFAIKHNQPDILRWLISKHIYVNDHMILTAYTVGSPQIMGVLHMAGYRLDFPDAVRYGTPEVLRYMFSVGFTPSAEVFNIAIERGNIPILECLTELGCRWDDRSETIAYNCRDRNQSYEWLIHKK